jgi:hypothetical protein
MSTFGTLDRAAETHKRVAELEGWSLAGQAFTRGRDYVEWYHPRGDVVRAVYQSGRLHEIQGYVTGRGWNVHHVGGPWHGLESTRLPRLELSTRLASWFVAPRVDPVVTRAITREILSAHGM